VKAYTMICFERWVQSVGGRAEAAALLSVGPAQVTRWVNAAAVLSRDGTIYVPSAGKYKKPKIDQE